MRHLTRKLIVASAAAIVVAVMPLSSQAPTIRAALLAQNVEGPRFDVASIKRIGPTVTMVGPIVTTPSRFSATSVPAGLISRAFGLPAFLFVNLDRVPKDYYEVNATLPQGATKDDIPAMLRNLLVERFHLRYHSEVREVKRFELNLAEGATKLKTAGAPSDARGFTVKPGADGFPVFPPGFDVGPVGFAGRWAIQRVGITIADFAKQLEGSQLDGVVVDRTGLTGKFDILLKWGTTLGTPSPDATNALEFSEPPLLKALRDQLGLIVREGKGPAEVIVIDSIDADATPN
jgi:uncharacterized protein (TIGR03435 family)